MRIQDGRLLGPCPVEGVNIQCCGDGHAQVGGYCMVMPKLEGAASNYVCIDPTVIMIFIVLSV